jgi:uncharacterized membrane protein (DUF485 family)
MNQTTTFNLEDIMFENYVTIALFVLAIIVAGIYYLFNRNEVDWSRRESMEKVEKELWLIELNKELKQFRK